MRSRLSVTLATGAATLAVAVIGNSPAAAHWVGAGSIKNAPASHSAAVSVVRTGVVKHATARRSPAAVPGCSVATGALGDAYPDGLNPNGTAPVTAPDMDSLDLTDLRFSTDAHAGTLTATMVLGSTNSGPGGTPMIWGEGNEYTVDFSDNNRVMWMDAEYPGTLDPTNPPAAPGQIPIDANFGHYESGLNGGKLLVSDGTAVGLFDTTNNTLSLTAPLGAMHIAKGDRINGAIASSAMVTGEPETVRTYVRPYVLQAWGVVTGTPVWPIVDPNLPVHSPISQLFLAVDGAMATNYDYIVGGTCVAPEQ